MDAYCIRSRRKGAFAGKAALGLGDLQRLFRTVPSYDMDKMQQRILRTQQAYNYISAIVQSNMAEYLNKEIATQEDENDYYHSDDFINNNA